MQTFLSVVFASEVAKVVEPLSEELFVQSTGLELHTSKFYHLSENRQFSLLMHCVATSSSGLQ